MHLGGTANLAVLGGNVPPRFGTGSALTQGCIPGAPGACGTVARPQKTSAASFRLRQPAGRVGPFEDEPPHARSHGGPASQGAQTVPDSPHFR